MPPITKKQTITPSSLDETSVQPIEKESLISADLEKGIHFFSDKCVVHVANRLELRQKAYEYVHKIYKHKGYTKNESSNLWLSIYDALPDTATLVAEDENGNIGGIFSGHFKDAHRKAMELGKKVYGTKVPLDNQICFFNSWPEDSELNQAQYKALNFMMTASNKLITRDGAMVLLSAAYEGRGYHSLM